MNEEITTINITMERYLALLKVVEAVKDNLWKIKCDFTYNENCDACVLKQALEQLEKVE